MRAELQAAISLLVGIVTLRLSLSRLYLDFVKPAMRPWLIASGVVLVVFGATAFLRAVRHDHTDAHGHDEHHVPRAAWLLILPVLVLLLITPNPLGSFAAGRQATVRIDPSANFDPLPAPKRGAIEISVSEFVDRALYDEDQSLKGKLVRLTGFVTPAGTRGSGEFYITRFVISCCAADARSSRVGIFGKPAPPIDSWITVTGTWRPAAAGSKSDPTMDVKTLEPIPQPEVPYESY
jgi:uncharacterized repeat protein (TIGR03943 family)